MGHQGLISLLFLWQPRKDSHHNILSSFNYRDGKHFKYHPYLFQHPWSKSLKTNNNPLLMVTRRQPCTVLWEKSGIIGKSLPLRQRQVKIVLGWLIHFGKLCIFYYFVNRNHPKPMNSNRQFLDKFPFFGRLCSSGVNIEDYL